MRCRIGVIDYGMGNLHSASKALEHVAPGAQVLVSSDPDLIRGCDRVLLPGVGAIRDCMAEIRRRGFDQLVEEVAREKPLLAICVGIQALMSSSEENGGVKGLNLFPGQVRFFGDDLKDTDDAVLKVPHMGWNRVFQKNNHPLWTGVADGSRFYFVHSYYVENSDSTVLAGETQYGVTFASALSRGNVFAVQFHPEKSQKAGLQLLKNFVNWDGES